ncbi:glycosyltransferase family 2 protein [Methanococcoides sp. SA1]|nr:glycosyltransferase family 2 protein [Methanococcoides sp. SA1]
MALISVVIPLYNKELYIKRAIDSILSQTFQEFEIIIINDGSTDRSAEIVESIIDKRIILIHQKNAGISAARNAGIKKANGDTIAFLDADDEWLPNFLETIIRLQQKFPDAGIYGTGYEVCFPSSIVKRIYEKEKGERVLDSYFGESVKFRHTIFNSSSFASPKEILLEVGGYSNGVKWSEDGLLWGKIALNYPISYSPEVCSIYHQYSANNSTNIVDYLESPFLKYTSTISKDELLKRNDLKDLEDYLALTQMAAISRNIYSGYGSSVRKDLAGINLPQYKWIKSRLLIMSYIPYYLMRIILKHAKTLSFFKRKISNR